MSSRNALNVDIEHVSTYDDMCSAISYRVHWQILILEAGHKSLLLLDGPAAGPSKYPEYHKLKRASRAPM
jgi:hypothetical protein